MAQLRILLADDHTVVRQGLRKVLEERPDWEVVAEAGDGREAVQQAEELKPDVAILDVAMPLLNGIEATRQIVKRSPATRVLVLTMHADEAYVKQILQGRRDRLSAEGLGRRRSDSGGGRGVAGQVVLQPGDRPGDAGRLRPAACRQRHHRPLRIAVGARARDLPADRRGEGEQGNRRTSCRSARAPSRPTAPASWRSSTSTAPPRSSSTPSAAASFGRSPNEATRSSSSPTAKGRRLGHSAAGHKVHTLIPTDPDNVAARPEIGVQNRRTCQADHQAVTSARPGLLR